MTIRAAVLYAPNEPFRIEEVELQLPRAGEVLVKVEAVGVCHSDWHLVTGDTKHPFPLVAGHEGAGIIETIGEGVEGFEIDDLVALNWAPSCGTCFYCNAGRPALCSTYVDPIWAGTMIDGTTRLSKNGKPIYHYSALACFAEYCVVPAKCCVKMPEHLEPEMAAVIGCAVATGVGSVLNTAKVQKGSSVVVLGCGGVGLSTVMGAKLAGAYPIIAVDPLWSRRIAAIDVGAHIGHEDVSAIKELTGGRGADYVFEAVGKPELQELAVEIARPGGTVIFSGLSPNGSATNIPGARLVREEKTVMGSYYGTCDAHRDFPLYAQMYLEGKLPLDRLVSHRYGLSDINKAYKDMLSGESTRGVIEF
ncbi:MAG: Zn-dependent alcohol dehydrogenase [Chlorobia bacterium]|nr:Zn-dependent alcohol dehydrogenase [Fimbriimonadaceae bacterium]